MSFNCVDKLQTDELGADVPQPPLVDLRVTSEARVLLLALYEILAAMHC